MGSVSLSEDLLQELFLTYHQILAVIEELKEVGLDDEQISEAEVTILPSAYEGEGIVAQRFSLGNFVLIVFLMQLRTSKQ